MPDSIDLLEKRTARLEALVGVLLLVVLAGGVALLSGAAAGTDTLRAASFQLLGSDGMVRAELASRDGNPGLYLKDESGADRLAIFHEPDTSGLYVMDPEGVTRIGVAQFGHGGGGVALHGPNSKGAAVLYLKDRGSLRFFDAEGKVSYEVPEPPPDD